MKDVHDRDVCDSDKVEYLSAVAKHCLDDEIASTVSSMSDFASDGENDPPDVQHMTVQDATSEYRFVQDSENIGPAPFTKPHFISASRSAPFPSPNTAIDIPFGPDLGCYIHVPRTLRAAEISLAELAIFWLWSGHRSVQGAKATIAHTRGPSIPPQMVKRQILGPPEAPYSITESTFPPFLGPRTCIHNIGMHLHGWVLHVPRYLTTLEITIATANLSDIANEPFGWGYEHDPICALSVRRTADEQAALVDMLKQQDRDVTFLKKVIGLDFSAQDDKIDGNVPIWIERASIEAMPITLVKPTILSTPPSTGRLDSSRKADIATPETLSDIEEGYDVLRTADTTASSMDTVRSTFSSDTATAKRITDVDTLPDITVNAKMTQQDGELIFEASIDDVFGTRNENCFPDAAFVQLDPADLAASAPAKRPLEEKGSGHADLEVANTVGATSLSRQGPCCCSAKIMPWIDFDKVYTRYICLVIFSFFGSLILFLFFAGLQEYPVRPSHMLAFVRDTSGRRNAVFILLVIVGPALGLILRQLLRSKISLATMLVVVCGWMSAIQT